MARPQVDYTGVVFRNGASVHKRDGIIKVGRTNYVTRWKLLCPCGGYFHRSSTSLYHAQREDRRPVCDKCYPNQCAESGKHKVADVVA